METRPNWRSAESESAAANFKWSPISKLSNKRLRFQAKTIKFEVENSPESLRISQSRNQQVQFDVESERLLRGSVKRKTDWICFRLFR